MRVIKRAAIREVYARHSKAASALESWLKVALNADWKSIQDVRENYPSADSAEVASGNQVTIFNICGNSYRLIVSIKYRWSMVYFLRFLTHAEYDKNQWKGQL